MRNVDVSSSHPNEHTFVALLKACIRLRDMRTSFHVHVECDSRGFLHSDISLATTLVDTYAKCGSIERTRQVFDKLHVRDTISWTSLIVFERLPKEENHMLEIQSLSAVGENHISVNR